jgi:hypothetical protein
MAFSARFPKQVGEKTVWEEVRLQSHEEKEVEQKARVENYKLLRESIADARNIAEKDNLEDEASIISLAIALFDKRASHHVYWKENRAKDKFDGKP